MRNKDSITKNKTQLQFFHLAFYLKIYPNPVSFSIASITRLRLKVFKFEKFAHISANRSLKVLCLPLIMWGGHTNLKIQCIEAEIWAKQKIKCEGFVSTPFIFSMLSKGSMTTLWSSNSIWWGCINYRCKSYFADI